MPDQAEKLRELVHGAPPPNPGRLPGPPTIVVSGGKGGVGTTTVAVNLAAALADRGRRVVAVDAAQQHADLAQVAGMGSLNGGTVADILAGRCRAADALAPGPVGMLLLASRWAPKASPDFSRHAQQRLLAELRSLAGLADVIVVDVGSGLSPWIRRFWLRAELVTLVTTPDDVALMDTYATIKLATAELVASDVRVLVNQSESDSVADEAQTRLARACQRFLRRHVPALPALPRHLGDAFHGVSPNVRVWEAPNSPFGHAVLWLAHAVDESLSSAGKYCGTAISQPSIDSLDGTPRAGMRHL